MSLLSLFAFILVSSLNAIASSEAHMAAARKYTYPYNPVIDTFVARGGTVAEIDAIGEMTKERVPAFHIMLELLGASRNIQTTQSYYDGLKNHIYDSSRGRTDIDDTRVDKYTLTYFWRAGGTPSLLQEWLTLPLLRDSIELFSMIYNSAYLNGTLPTGEYLNALMGLRDSRNQPLVTTARDLNRAVGHEIDPSSMGRLVHDTAKPNAVYLVPRDDWNGAFGAWKAELYRRMKDDYDVVTSIINIEQDFCSVLRGIPDLELVVIGGHGDSNSLAFGGEDRRVRSSTKPEEFYLDTGDRELARCFETLTDTATIFLKSCSNAQSRFLGDNLARFVWRISGRKRVIAAKAPVGHTVIRATLPLNISLYLDGFSDDQPDEAIVIPAGR